MSELHRIRFAPNVCTGRSCVRGLRTRGKDSLELLAAAATHQKVPGDYPRLDAGDIMAAFRHCSRGLDHVGPRVASLAFLVPRQMAPALARWLRDSGPSAPYVG